MEVRGRALRAEAGERGAVSYLVCGSFNPRHIWPMVLQVRKPRRDLGMKNDKFSDSSETPFCLGLADIILSWFSSLPTRHSFHYPSKKFPVFSNTTHWNV